MFFLRVLITCAILIPYWLVRMPQNTVEIFIVAVVAFGIGRIVEAIVVKNKKTANAPKAPPPPR